MKYAAIFTVLLVLAAGCLSQPTSETGSSSDSMEKTESNRHAVFETSMGAFTVELYEQRTPRTTANFIELAENGFYEGTRFHRVIDGFMIQGGDPLTKNDSLKNQWGTGGPGYAIDDEFHPELKHDSKGVLSMANSGPNTGGSQFFITVAPTPWLDGKHAVFGEVVENYAVVEQISKVETEGPDRPVEPVTVQSIEIVQP